jgi:hypothetical protein
MEDCEFKKFLDDPKKFFQDIEKEMETIEEKYGNKKTITKKNSIHKIRGKKITIIDDTNENDYSKSTHDDETIDMNKLNNLKKLIKWNKINGTKLLYELHNGIHICKHKKLYTITKKMRNDIENAKKIYNIMNKKTQDNIYQIIKDNSCTSITTIYAIENIKEKKYDIKYTTHNVNSSIFILLMKNEYDKHCGNIINCKFRILEFIKSGSRKNLETRKRYHREEYNKTKLYTKKTKTKLSQKQFWYYKNKKK